MAAGLFALNGMAIFFTAELVPPSAEMLAGVLAVWALFRLSRNRSLAAHAFCGSAWGMAAITRPNFLTLFPLVAVAPLFLTRRLALRPRLREASRAARILDLGAGGGTANTPGDGR